MLSTNEDFTYKIFGFHGGDYEGYLLGCDALIKTDILEERIASAIC
jgi:hypothetical protein